MDELNQQVETAAAALRAFLSLDSVPVALFHVETGFAPRALLDGTPATMPLERLPGMPPAVPHGSQGAVLCSGVCGARHVLLAHGQRYLWEGMGVAPCVLPVGAAVRCGVRNLVLVGTGVSLREEFKPGTWLVATDYINNQGPSPLAGNPGLSTNAFPDMSDAFCQELVSLLVNAAGDVGVTARLGVYQADLGPQFATPAEADAGRRNGADVLGFGVVQETIAAHAMGARVAALIVVTAMAAGPRGRRCSHADTLEACRHFSPALVRALRLVVARLPE